MANRLQLMQSILAAAVILETEKPNQDSSESVLEELMGEADTALWNAVDHLRTGE